MSSYPMWALWAFAAGALIPVLGSLNAGLGRSLGSPTAAVAVLFVVALLAALALLAAGTYPLPSAERLLAAPPQLFLGGFIVVFYVASVTLLVPRFGIGNTILFAVVAQLVISALMDHFGLLGVPVRPVGLARAGGLALMIAGLIVAQLSAAKAS